jgi:hypothetical protein
MIGLMSIFIQTHSLTVDTGKISEKITEFFFPPGSENLGFVFSVLIFYHFFMISSSKITLNVVILI